jgi:anti-sigma B factor antagonist
VTTTSSAWIEVSADSGTLILRLCGELDLASRDVLEPAVMAAIPTAYKVILDLVDLTYCDSIGIAMFLAAHENAEAAGTILVFADLQPSVRRVFEISGIDKVVNITDV